MVAMLIAALATACGGDDATSTPIPTTAPTSTPTKAPTATPVPPSAVDETQMEDKMGALTEGSVLIALNPQNDSGQSGWATLTARGSDTEVVLSLSPGAMESKLVHIHEGACGNDTLGGVLHGLTDFSGGTSTTLVESVSLDSLLQGNLAINSHNINDPSVYTACGNIPSKADTVTIALNPQNDSGQSGWATLTARGSDTEVVLSLSPGAMESKLVHIHEGACGNDTLGGVLHGLTDFSGGTSSTLLDGVLPRIHRRTRMDGVRTAEGGG